MPSTPSYEVPSIVLPVLATAYSLLPTPINPAGKYLAPLKIARYIAFIAVMRYTLFFTSCLLPLASSLLPAPCSLLPLTQRFVPHGYKTCYNQSRTWDK
ncbi:MULTISPECIES: hypothetical protein [unclassified Moorena]|uniref:hypothetical protein n=1 Tax=unclassified Moorena TaxID=2683338 RepID=UPI001401755F|nr:MULTISPECIES: hypothetical protein [unclassified Moorena]NEO11118.1 hypothetical protein [Moorena sp. SIO3E8]NEP98026.1 hypothetical protein [Moorena sp. SIO3F7]